MLGLFLSTVQGRDGFVHSRLLVTGDSIDEVSGFVLTRDLLFAALRKEGKRKVADFARDLPRVSETMDLDALLDLLLDRDAHIALVEDDYAGTAGLVTMTGELPV